MLITTWLLDNRVYIYSKENKYDYNLCSIEYEGYRLVSIRNCISFFMSLLVKKSIDLVLWNDLIIHFFMNERCKKHYVSIKCSNLCNASEPIKTGKSIVDNIFVNGIFRRFSLSPTLTFYGKNGGTRKKMQKLS